MSLSTVTLPNRHLFREGLTGLILGIQSVVNTLAVAFIMFNGSLTKYLPIGIIFALFSAIMLRIIISIKSSSPIIIAGVQELYGVIAAIIITQIANSMSLHSPTISPLPTIFVALMLLTLVFGFCITILGQYKLGNAAQFIP